jgi:hypothetical protein
MPTYSYSYPVTLQNLVYPTFSALNPNQFSGNALRLIQLNQTEDELRFTIPFPDTSTFTSEDDQKPVIYNYATNSFILKPGILWTPDHSPYGRIWHKCYDDSTYTINGSNLLLTSTNQISLHAGSYNVVASDEDGQYKEAGVYGAIGWKFLKYNSGWARIANGVYMADPTSYTIGCVFSSDSTQLAPNKSPGSLWSVSAANGTDIRLFITNDGIGYNKITYRHNGVQTETTDPYLLFNDSIYIIVVSYNGTSYSVYLNGALVLSSAAPSAGVGASDLLLGAFTEGEGEYGGNYSFGGWIYDFAVLETHDTTERQKLEGYFGKQHNIQYLLPISHPYVNIYPSAN